MDEFRETTEAAKAAKARQDINLLKMIESRIGEIVKVEAELKKKCPKSFYQRLPRFMRRRAASHQIMRIPKRVRPDKEPVRSQKKLLEFKRLMKKRRKTRFVKHKRILRKHANHVYKDPNKCVLHKWFAKRFKMSERDQVPLYNNTKNQRNLYRQTRYGCAYLSLAELICLRISAEINSNLIERLNKLTKSVSGFTFAARALDNNRYEVAVHLYTLDDEYMCPALVSKHEETCLNLWVPRDKAQRIGDLIAGLEVPVKRVEPRYETRIRLVGPEARSVAKTVALDRKAHEAAVEDVDKRLLRNLKFGLSIGRYVDEQYVRFTYYQTHPFAVDLVFRGKTGRMTWFDLIDNKAHLVGGKRDVERLLAIRYEQSFRLVPDCNRNSPTRIGRSKLKLNTKENWAH